MQTQISNFRNEISNTIDPFVNSFEALGTSFNPFGDDHNNPTNQNHLLTQALKYADDGLKVFPLHYPVEDGCSCRQKGCSVGKHPLTKNGFKEATTDQSQIVQWWNRNPKANIGIVTGENSFYVLDIDISKGKKGIESLDGLIKKHGALPRTLTATTGSGGRHYCFKYSGKEKLGCRNSLLNGIDFKGLDGYIVAYPSLHEDGRNYSWDNENPLAEMPEWLVEFVLDKNKTSVKGKSAGQTSLISRSQSKIHNLSSYPGMEGDRDETLFKLGSSMREMYGFDERQLLGCLQGVNKNLSEPLPDSQVEKIASGICKYEPGNRLDLESENSFLDFDLGGWLSKKYETESKRDPKELLGYKLERFKNIEKILDGVQSGFYIIAAETNVGKTAFLTNVYLDLVENNEVMGIFLSMDDPRKDIVNKILAQKTNISITKLQKRQASKTDQKKLKESYDWLIDLAKQERIKILDQGNLSSVKQIETLASQINKPFFIALDGLFNVEVGNFDFKRDENIERANLLKRIADKYEIPLICTAEVRKSTQKQNGSRQLSLDDIMETAKFAYNANLVWLLSENGAEEERSNGFLNHSVSLNLNYAKNKLTGYKKMKNLTYHTSFGKVSELDQIL